MHKPHLVYFADPMCSWCWGFAPVIEAISERFGTSLPIRLIMGGLRPWTREPMTAHDLGDVRNHWEHVHEASGQPFDLAFFDRERFVYDTEPPSRAIVVLRRHGMDTGLAALRRVHRAFYAENRDVTDTDTLAAIAAELGVDATIFRNEFSSEAAIEETRGDFEIAQSAGIRGFPTLIAGTGDDNPYTLITHGFQPAGRILPAIESLLGGTAASPSAEAGGKCD
ncbi:MAG: protein-disulfide isomerase [Acidiphilium sp. 37-64-53]|uniref:DsbA family protein n=1 Tax=unclassified Acidiphilium TaxID=2617493 RepID=UPI000BD9A5F5|nr:MULTISPECIES: DsbA family protein [unclassified Acidiphilium]OYW00245.1 MAG: protein-disulfide isomerase [Acidiphilium sp. 37-64-53]